MKQEKIIQAYNATEQLSKNENLQAEVLWSIYMLRKTLLPHVEFQLEREKAIKDKYAKYADETGKISGEYYLNFMREIDKLLNMDKDIGDIQKLELTLTDGMGITVQTMEALDDFITFKK